MPPPIITKVNNRCLKDTNIKQTYIQNYYYHKKTFCEKKGWKKVDYHLTLTVLEGGGGAIYTRRRKI